MTFTVGPQLLNASNEDAPDEPAEKAAEGDSGDRYQNGHANSGDEEQGEGQDQEQEDADEQTSLLPDVVDRNRKYAQNKAYTNFKYHWDRLPVWLQKVLDFALQFINAPVIATAVGLFIGLIPPIQKAFFRPADQGGIFNAWITSSLQNLGGIFAALQTLTVGVKLATAMKESKNGSSEGEEDSPGAYPWIPSLFVEVTRHVICPALSIPFIYLIATKTSWLSNDPILCFTMMLMPTGEQLFFCVINRAGPKKTPSNFKFSVLLLTLILIPIAGPPGTSSFCRMTT